MKNGENLFHIKVRVCDAHGIFNEVLEPKGVRDEMKKDYYTKRECVFGRHILFRIMESKWIISY